MLEIFSDREYPEWLWTLLDKKPALSELRKKHIEDMHMPEVSWVSGYFCRLLK